MSINNVIGLSASKKMDLILALAQKQAESLNPDHNKINSLVNHINDLQLIITKKNKEISALRRIVSAYKKFKKEITIQLEKDSHVKAFYFF